MTTLRRVAAVAVLVTMAACGSSPAAAPKPISYGRGGIELRDARDVGKLTGAPNDFKQYIAGAADATGAGSDPKDKCSPRIFVDRIDGGFATGGVFDCGGAQLIWARRGGGIWRQIWGGQITPDCPTMRKYRVPVSIVGKTCWDVTAQKDVPYPG
jgi:hypothetical protein